MAAPSSFISKITMFRTIVSPLAYLLPRAKITSSSLNRHVQCNITTSSSVKRLTCVPAGSSSSTLHVIDPKFSIPVPSICLVPSRSYGHKKRVNPEKITKFEYSGDLRNIPELDKSTVLYKYRELEHELEGNEVLKKLCTLEFASRTELNEHKRKLVRDRIVHLFGPDSKLEQLIALKTLYIRKMIPTCIKFKTDKLNKTKLVQTIHSRRRLLTKLRELDHERFEWLLRELKIRYVIPKDREEYKGWKHNLRVAKQDEATSKQRQKLEELKAKFEAEKKIFYEQKAKILAQMDQDLEAFGLTRNDLEEQIARDKHNAEEEQKRIRWEEMKNKALQIQEMKLKGATQKKK